MSPAELSQLDALRRLVENLSDDAIRAFVDTIIRAILHGMADELADRMVDALVAQLAVAGGPGQGGGNDQGEGAEPSSGTAVLAPPGGQDTTPPAAPKTKRSPAQDAISHTCEICSRTGTRRYVETATGWRCSPTATKCPGNRVFPPPPSHVAEWAPAADEQDWQKANPSHGAKPEPVSGIPAKTIPAKVTPPDRTDLPTVTARCQDCTRTWILTGRVLQLAAEQHELKHAHIVDIVGDADD